MLLLAGALATSGAASAHDLHDSFERYPGWTWDPWIVLPLLAAALLFLTGWLRLCRRSTLGLRALKRRFGLFASGWLTLAVSLVSPLHEAGERSFAAHMIEHELLMLLAAPLLVLSSPLPVMLWAFPIEGRRAIGRITRSKALSTGWTRLTAPFTATVIQAIALWCWHTPALFDLALSDDRWHAAQHLSFLTSALLFWTAVISPRPVASARGAAAFCLFATAMVSGALGALMALSQSPWYPAYARLGMAPFGLTPAEDQQFAGLIMWIPGGLVHAGAALALIATMLKTPVGTEAIANAP